MNALEIVERSGLALVLVAMLVTEIALVRVLREAVREIRQLRRDVPALLGTGFVAILLRDWFNTQRNEGR